MGGHDRPRDGGTGGRPRASDAATDEFDRVRRRVLWAMPSGLYVLGSRAGERRNLMTASWAGQVATEPKLVGVSVEASALTCELVKSGRVFCLSLVARDDRSVVRRFVKPATDDPERRTLNGHPYREAATGAPVLESSLAYLDCEVHHEVDLGSHTLFVGEVVDAAFIGEEGTPVLRMEDTRMSYGG
jgi:flavin reductase (DIM6/NTAB) family NADH-FMN oxidoreductase RutF